MKAYIKKIPFVLLTLLFIPSFVFASWWNPFTWVKKNTNTPAAATVQKKAESTTATAKTKAGSISSDSIVKDIVACSSLWSADISTCQQKFTRIYKNISACDTVSPINPVYEKEGAVWNRRDFCRVTVANLFKDVSLCNVVVNVDMKRDCLGMIDKTKSNNICTYRPDRDGCVRFLASKVGDLALCDLLKTKEGKRYTAGSSRDSCYLSVATGNFDINICNQIIDGATKDMCFDNIGSRTDLSVCNYIKDIEYKGQKWGCYISNARNNRNRKVCDLIEDKNRKQYCYDEMTRMEIK